MDRLGIGVLSFAHGHVQVYCSKIKTFPDAVLVAAWDDDIERGTASAERHGMEFVADVDALLARDDIHAVIVTSETNKHADLIEKACAAGKHILCQKPMATTLADCDRIIAAVEKSGVHFQMAFQMRCDPLNQKIKEWIDSGAVGRIGGLRRRHCINFLFNPTIASGPSAWHIDPVANVGMFFDDAVHAADFFYWLMGKPKSVIAEIDNVLTNVAPDDTGLAIYRWPSGAMGALFNSSVTLAGENTCEVYGDEGVIIQNYDDGVSVGHAPQGVTALKLFRKSTGQWETFDYPLPPNHGERLGAVPRPWLDNILSGAPSSVTARDGKATVEMCLAAYESARDGRRILLSSGRINMPKKQNRKPNIVLIAIDSLRADHMSGYGYDRLTTPHIDRFAQGGTLFENNFSAHIPTTSAYSSMLTGRDVMGTQVVALRHKGPLRGEVPTLAEILREAGYDTTCVGFSGNPASRGFDKYLSFSGWGSWNEGRSPKAENLNQVAIPELNRLASGTKPFLLFLRHMDPHAPYLPPAPYERMFYGGNELDKKNKSMKPVMDFKPFADFFKSWMPPGITDKDYMIAQYDGAVAYMDACIQTIFQTLEARGILDETIVVVNADHGETLYDHDCWFDHHGLYDQTLHVPLIIRYPAKVPADKRVSGYTQHKDLVPTILDLADIRTDATFDGKSLLPMANGEVASHESEFYITECTWMRKHGWRTPEWKLILALEPDFHFKPMVELYNLVTDPGENNNVAEANGDIVALLTGRMEAWLSKREEETGLPNPIHHQGDWHGKEGVGPFQSSQQAYDTLHIGDPKSAAKLQAESRK